MGEPPMSLRCVRGLSRQIVVATLARECLCEVARRFPNVGVRGCVVGVSGDLRRLVAGAMQGPAVLSVRRHGSSDGHDLVGDCASEARELRRGGR